MHYGNGREAKNGDKVVLLQPVYDNGTAPKVIGFKVVKSGILYDAQAGNDYCNGKIAPISSNDSCPNLKECLHEDDVRALLGADITAVPDTSK